jgi:hypothetical protein
VVGISFERILKEVGLWSLSGVGAIVVVAVAIRLLMKRRERRRLAVELADRDGGDGVAEQGPGPP